jgi:hypothetical protein
MLASCCAQIQATTAGSTNTAAKQFLLTAAAVERVRMFYEFSATCSRTGPGKCWEVIEGGHTKVPAST